MLVSLCLQGMVDEIVKLKAKAKARLQTIFVHKLTSSFWNIYP